MPSAPASTTSAKADNTVIVLNKRDLEGYLMDGGYIDAFESAIKAATDDDGVDKYAQLIGCTCQSCWREQ